jgi:hypothetical protein
MFSKREHFDSVDSTGLTSVRYSHFYCSNPLHVAVQLVALLVWPGNNAPKTSKSVLPCSAQRS